MTFPTSDLARALPTADPLLYRMMAERVEHLESRPHRDPVGRVRAVMETVPFWKIRARRSSSAGWE